jgi:tetratricopeptide (TPR) repeat protein
VPQAAKRPKVKERAGAAIDWRLPALLFLAVLFAYANTPGLGFALDSVNLIHGDPRIRAATAGNLDLILKNDYWWPSSVDVLYRPITTASFLFNYAILGNGAKAPGYHLLNLLLHLANAWLVFQLALRVLRDRRMAWFAAALWAVHPIGSESVANIAGRADLLATLFVLSGLLLYIRLMAVDEGGWQWRAGVLAASAAAGMFSKESAAVLPGLMLLWDVAFGAGWRRGGTHRLAAYAAVLLPLAMLLMVRHQVFAAAPVPEMPWTDNPMRDAGFWAARGTAIKIIGMELGLLAWPLRLASERGFDQIALATVADWRAWLALAAVSAILAAAVARRRKDPILFWAAGFFAIALLPVSNLIFPIGATMAERFLYLPSIGFAIAAAALLERLDRRVPVKYAAVVLLILLAGRTFARNRAWQDNLTLARNDVENAPRSARLQDLLAGSLYAADPSHNLDAAIAAGERAWAILEPLPPARIQQQTPAHLGAWYRLKGETAGAQARIWYERSAAVLLRAREASQAIEHAYDEAQLSHGKPLATRVAYQPVYVDLGITMLRLGRPDEAIEAFRYAREVDPRTPAVYELLADAYTAKGDTRRAAVTLLGQTLLLGATAPGMERLAKAYGEGSCAIHRGNGFIELNEACPQLKEDVCSSAQDLSDMLRKARLPDAAGQFEERARRQACR